MTESTIASNPNRDSIKSDMVLIQNIFLSTTNINVCLNTLLIIIAVKSYTMKQPYTHPPDSFIHSFIHKPHLLHLHLHPILSHIILVSGFLVLL